MTLAPPQQNLTDPAGDPATEAVVTAVLVLRGPASALGETLDALARQTRAPDRLVVVDAGLDGNAVETVRTHRGIHQAVPDLSYVTTPHPSSTAGAVRAALAAASQQAPTADPLPSPAGHPLPSHVWVLTADSVAAPMTLARLLDAVRRSPSVGAAGPKLLEWDRPDALRSVGVQVTRSGRLVPAPAPGEPDQGQYDRRSDVLAIPATGMLVERALFDDLGGPDPVLGDFGGDLDFSWRAQQAGRRVVVVPRATVRTGAAPVEGDVVPPPDRGTRVRRQARRVALARCATWSVPVLAAWVVLSSVGAAAALLLAKRPRAAWAELSDVGAVLTAGRVLGARWRSRGTRAVRRRDLHGLFVPARTVLRHTADLVHDQVTFDDDTDGAPRRGTVAVESGPVSDEAQDLNILGSTWASRAVRNPGLLSVLAMAVVAAVATRQMGGSLLDRLDHGIAGGELLGLRGTGSSLFHAWLDGWHGAGFGQQGEVGPHLVVVAGLAWLVSHLPLVGTPASPAGAAVALLVTGALPLATLTAYLSGRVVTRSRWPRALAALAWSTTAVLATAVGAGRLGGVVAAILLPLVAAGITTAARRTGTATGTAATVVVVAVLGAFAPALLAPVAAAAVAIVLFGPVAAARVRGLALLGGPLLLLGPWVGELLERPALLLTGPGLSVWGTGQAAPWELALLHPGGPGSYPVLLSAPVVVAGVLGQLRAGRRGHAALVLGVIGLAGLAYAVAAPRIELGTVPAGLPEAGAPVTAWAGTGLLVWGLALVATALLGAEGLAVSRARGGWRALSRWPVGAALVAAVVVSAGWTTWRTVGDTLGAWVDPRPAVAVDQAESGISNRMVLLEVQGEDLTFRVLARENGDVARALPARAEASSAQVGDAVTALFRQGDAPGATTPAAALSDLAVGFVGLRTDDGDPRIRALDATAGLSRLGEHEGVMFWRVLPGGGRTDDGSVAPARARLVTKTSDQTVPVSGDHSRLDTKVVVPQGASLVLAEPGDWVRHARVTSDGQVLAPRGEQAAYPVPAGAHTLEVQVLPHETGWRWLQGLALLVAVFIAIPFGNRASRRRS